MLVTVTTECILKCKTYRATIFVHFGAVYKKCFMRVHCLVVQLSSSHHISH